MYLHENEGGNPCKKFCWWLKYSNLTEFTRSTQYPVSTIIVNPTLACFNIIGKLALLGYLLYAFFHERHYYQLSVPKVHVDYYRSKKQKDYSPEDFIYCSNDTYDFYWDKGWDYSNSECISPVWGDSYSQGDNNFFFFPTFIQATSEIRRRNCAPDDDIFDDPELSYEDCTQISQGADTICACSKAKNYMMMGVEDIDFEISLTYYVSETAETGMTGDEKVGVVVKDHDNNIIEKVVGERHINFTVAKWLEAAGVNLDTLNLGVTSKNGTSHSNPFWRTTGVNIVVDTQFYNVPTYHGQITWQWKKVAIVHIRREPGWASTGSHLMWHEYPDYYLLRRNKTGEFHYSDSYEYGVKFYFLGSGYIGELEWKAIQDYFVSSIVLLAVIPTIVAFLGMKLFGFNSEIYSMQLRQRPEGIIKDMELFSETWKYLFNQYKIERRSNKFCCLSFLSECVCGHTSGDSSGEMLNAKQFDKFCVDRYISSDQKFQMWKEINNDPYLASKNFFTKKTLWNAVRSNYDRRGGVERNLIQKMWKTWDEESCKNRLSKTTAHARTSTRFVNREVVDLLRDQQPSNLELISTRHRVRL